VFQLKPLTDEEVRGVLKRALEDKERGYGVRQVVLTSEAEDHLIDIAGGDARSALNALELAVESTHADAEGKITVDLAVAEEAIQRRALLYSRAGDEHYDTISAFIKSVRGSNPDAALYWLAKMLYAGEDPKFIMRRLLILASEDIGLADPNGIVVASACARALEWCGLPEAKYHLAEATVYLATAPKSNSLGAYFKAEALVEQEGQVEVPDHLKDASRDGRALGHGRDYKYPHDFPEHFVEQQYAPEAVEGKIFYEPGDQGFEIRIRERLEKWRAQLCRGAGEQGSRGAGEQGRK
jgi:putative ATPase